MDPSIRSTLETAIASLRAQSPFTWEQSHSASTSSRVVEVPWAANCIGRWNPESLFDIGFSLASLDYLGLLLEYASAPGHRLDAIDIIPPERVRNRYPTEWWSKIAATNVRIGDVREAALPSGQHQMVTCISVIEHIGFDKPSLGDPKSAFARATTPEGVFLERDAAIDALVLKRIHSVLTPGGRCLLSVPMGRGGPVLLRDSLGYYCAQWEYSPKDWLRLANAQGFELEEAHFFAADDALHWHRAPAPEHLGELESVPLSHSRGVGMAVLRKTGPESPASV